MRRFKLEVHIINYSNKQPDCWVVEYSNKLFSTAAKPKAKLHKYFYIASLQSGR